MATAPSPATLTPGRADSICGSRWEPLVRVRVKRKSLCSSGDGYSDRSSQGLVRVGRDGENDSYVFHRRFSREHRQPRRFPLASICGVANAAKTRRYRTADPPRFRAHAPCQAHVCGGAGAFHSAEPTSPVREADTARLGRPERIPLISTAAVAKPLDEETRLNRLEVRRSKPLMLSKESPKGDMRHANRHTARCGKLV